MGLLFVGPNYGPFHITRLAAQGDFTFAALGTQFISVCCRAQEVERIMLTSPSEVVYLALMGHYLFCVQRNGSVSIFDSLNNFRTLILL